MLYNCQTCDKVFKRNQDLKTHNTKIHNTSEISIQRTNSIEYFGSDQQTLTQDDDLDDEIDFNLSDNSQENDYTYFNFEKRYKYVSIQTETQNSGIEITTQTNVTIQTNISTQTDVTIYENQYIQIVEPIKTDEATHVKPKLQINGMLRETQKLYLNELPLICQDIKIFNGHLQILIDNKTYDITNAPILKQYKSDPVDLNNRVQKLQQYPFDLVSYKNYQPDTKEEPTYLNMRKDQQGNQFPALVAKMFAENLNFKCVYQQPQIAYFDIETYDTENADICPVASRNTSHISMISLIVEQTATLFHLDRYNLNIQQVTQKINQHSGREYIVETETEQNENALVLLFIQKLQQLSKSKTIILAGFNSSQDGRGTKVLGYDCSFILRNLSSDIKKEVRRCNGTGEFPTQLIQINVLPNVYFVDMMLMFDENTQIDKKDIQGRSLNSYLDFYKIPKKLVGNHKSERKTQINGGDITEYGAYCLYDSICLQLVQDSRNILNNRLYIAESYGLPLSMCLYQTVGNILSCLFLQKFVQSGFMITYSKISKILYQSYKGAHTGKCPKELQYKSLENVHIFDFASQYPNAGIQNNISPETYIQEKEEDCHAIQLNFEVGQVMEENQKIFAYFKNSKNIGIIPQFWRDTFDARVQTRKQQKQYQKNSTDWQILEVKQMALKLQINSLYGLLGANQSQFFKLECASAVTGFARYCLNLAIETTKQVYQIPRIMFADTDSLAIQYKGDDVKERFLKVNKLISEHFPRMALEFEKSYDFIVYPENSKSYANIKKGNVVVKGVPFNCYTLEYRTQLYNFFRDILTSKQQDTEDYKKQKQEICRQYVTTIQQKIFAIIENKDIQALQQYVKIVKLGKSQTANGTTTMSGYLEQNYPNIDNYNIIPFNCNPNKTYCVMPIELITTDNIDKIRVLDLVAFLCQPLKTFFKIDLHKSEKYLGVSVELGNVVLRIESTYKGNEKTQMPVQQAISEIKKNGNFKSYHEVMTNEINKMYFDIEHDTARLSAFKIRKYIQQVIQNQNVRIHIADGSNNNKMSYHVVVEILTNKQVNREIAKLLDYRIGKFKNKKDELTGVVDLKVYNQNNTLRLPNCVKIENKKIENRKLKILQPSEIKDFFITDIQQNYPSYIDFVSFNTEIPVTDAKQFQNTADMQSVKNMLKEKNIKIIIRDKNQIFVKNKPYTCPACQRLKENDNLRISNEKLYCYNQSCCGIQIETKYKEPKTKQLKQSIKQDSRLVKYSLNQGHHTFVKSQMGTGKTEELLRQLDKFKTVLVISFRRSFADDFSQKMGFSNYQDIKNHQINISEFPRLCVQLESLYRVVFDIKIDLIVFDEIESILSQFNAFEKKQNNINTQKFIELLRFKCLFMDALIQQSTIKIISSLSNVQNIQVYENSYKTQEQRKMIIETKPNREKILSAIKIDLQAGKKISVNCASKKLLELIFQQGIQMGLRCAKYTGDNNEVFEQFGKRQTMGTHKDQQIKNPNQYWIELDLLVYTGTISAGISFTQKHFDLHYGILKNRSSDVVSFIQGNHRVRDLADNIQKIYLFPIIHDDYNNTTRKVTEKQRSYNSRNVYIQNNQIQQLNTYLEARENCLRLEAVKLFLLWSQQSGYKILNVNQPQPENFQIPVISQQIPTTVFEFTEQEFNDLPRQMQQNNFSLTHCDEFKNIKIQIVKLAQLYQKTYTEIMDIYQQRNKQPKQWYKMIDLYELKIKNNLINLALTKTQIKKFTPEHFENIETELLEYCHQINQFQSQVVSTLNVTTDTLRTKYIKQIIDGLRTYMAIKDLKQEQIPEYLQTVSKKQENAVVSLNSKLINVMYKIESECIKTNVKVGDKRTTQRTYKFKLVSLMNEQNAEFFN